MVHPKNVTLVIKGALVLHNFLRNEVGVQYVGESTADYEDATGTSTLARALLITRMQQERFARVIGGRRFQQISSIPYDRQVCCGSNDATRIRDQFKNYFSSEIGSVSWQNARVTATH